MTRIYKFLSLFLLGALLATSCSKDELDVAALTDFPPGILTILPGSNGAKVVKGDWDVKVIFVDGTTSPLASGSVTLRDAADAEIASTSGSLSGTRDSLVIDGATFNVTALPEGIYTIEISVTDSKNQTQTVETTFELSNLPFAANHGEMFIAGAFNGWGADVMTLVADHIWEIQGIDLGGDPFKFKNCFDWCDEDWGDGNCDGIMESNMDAGGNADTNCGYSGLVNVRFNDETRSYTVTSAVTYASNVQSLFLLGTFNTFQGSSLAFNLVSDNTWVLNEVNLKPGDAFRFAEMPDFMGQNFGDANGDGVAEAFGSNIVIPNDFAPGIYSITFNDRTLAYSIDFLRFLSIGIIGSATPGGWDTDTDMDDADGDGIYTITLTLTDGEAKFREDNSWTVNWGSADFPSGTGELNGPNIPVTAGTYAISFNRATGAYNFASAISSVGIIGSATPGGWDTDTNMRDNGDGTYSLVVGLGGGEAKFRANDAWDINWGATAFPSGTAEANGPNIPVTAGIYLVTLDINTGAYNFAPASIGLIGSATPGGWDTDTDMTPTGTMGEVSLSVTLGDGEAKFRTNDAWTWNWGASTFPTGTGTADGPNIPVTAGNYTVRFNVNTGEYIFE